MGYRGPAPKPSVIEIAEGRPGHRPVNDREPQPLAIPPQCPSHLDDRARKEWDHLVPILLRMRVLTEADGMTLGNLCQAFSTMVKAHEKMAETGLLYKAPSGYVMQNPLLPVINTCVETITRLSREFGLTPAARARLSSAPQSETDEIEAALCG